MWTMNALLNEKLAQSSPLPAIPGHCPNNTTYELDALYLLTRLFSGFILPSYSFAGLISGRFTLYASPFTLYPLRFTLYPLRFTLHAFGAF
jgi:hypothetical protein